MVGNSEPRRVTVMGLGRFGGGLGAARWFARQGAAVTVTDLAPSEALAESVRALEKSGVKLVLGGHREKDFSNADLVVVNPAVRPDSPYIKVAREAGAALTTEINLVLERAAGSVLGVTGTAGKSTTTAMLGAMMRAHEARTRVGGNLGGSLLDEDEAIAAGAPVVLELSSFQLERCERSPSVAVVTNLAPNHLDWHGSEKNYFAAKENIVRFQDASSLAILNAEDARLASWKAPGRLARFSTRARGEPPCAWIEKGTAFCDLGSGPEEMFHSSSLRLPGQHNLANALAAALAARASGVPAPTIAAALDSFAPLAHRLEVVATLGGVTWVNDSKATTPESAMLAIEAYANRPVTLIAGGCDKGVPLEAFARLAARACRHVLLIGATAGALAKIMRAASEEVGGAQVEEAGELERAVRRASETASEGGVVLLAPGCASYDQFPNYEARGEAFRALVRSREAGEAEV